MGPFTFETYHNPFVQSISQLMLAPAQAQAQAAQTIGEAQARAALQRGQAWGGAAQNIGQTVAALPGQIQRAQQQGTVDQIQQLRLQDAQREQAGGKAVAGLMEGDQLPAGEVGPRKQNYLGSDGLYDISALSKSLGASGFGDKAPELLKSAENINASIVEHQKTQQQLANEHTKMLGFMADGAQKLAMLGMPLDQALDFVGQPAVTTGRLKPEEFSAAKQQLLQLPPEQQKLGLQSLMDAAAKISPTKTHAADSSETDIFGRVIAEGPKKPGEGQHVINGQLVDDKGQPIGAPVPPQRSPAKKAIESKSVMLNGRQAIVNYDPEIGKHLLPDGTDVSAQVTPIPAASIIIRNEQNAPVSLPAWATDDTRPSGPEANVLDQKTKMTPNGLYQAALNYIANGQYPTTGRGSDPVAVAQRAAVTSKVGAIAAASGMDEPALRAFYKANGASLAAQQKMFDNAQSNISTADRNVAELDKFLDKLPDTGSPLFNKPLRAFAKDVYGDPNMGPIATYLASVQNEYGKIITSSTSGSSVLTDSARHEAQQLVDPNATVAQMLGSIQALKTEGGNRLLSVGEQIQRIQQRIQAGPQGNNTSGSTAPVEHWERVNGVLKKVGG